MRFYSEEELEKLGTTWRIGLGINEETQPDAIDFLRRLKHLGCIKDYVRLPDSALPEAEAKYNPHDQTIYLRDSVYAQAQERDPHCRFTVFHEGAHAILGHEHERKRSYSPRSRTEKMVSAIRRDETQADKLAAVIMAPFERAQFSLDTTPAQIAAHFGLSGKAAWKRYDEFARLYRAARNIRRPLPAAVVDFLTEQKRRGFKVTSLPETAPPLQPHVSIYTGDACPNPNCGEFKMIRNGTSLRCEECGTETGEG